MSAHIIPLEDGKQVVVSSDDRANCVWISLWANGGSIGIALDPEKAVELSKALWYAAPIEARRAATTKIGAVHESGKGRPT